VQYKGGGVHPNWLDGQQGCRQVSTLSFLKRELFIRSTFIGLENWRDIGPGQFSKTLGALQRNVFSSSSKEIEVAQFSKTEGKLVSFVCYTAKNLLNGQSHKIFCLGFLHEWVPSKPLTLCLNVFHIDFDFQEISTIFD
jgi:hypothetical protein